MDEADMMEMILDMSSDANNHQEILEDQGCVDGYVKFLKSSRVSTVEQVLQAVQNVSKHPLAPRVLREDEALLRAIDEAVLRCGPQSEKIRTSAGKIRESLCCPLGGIQEGVDEETEGDEWVVECVDESEEEEELTDVETAPETASDEPAPAAPFADLAQQRSPGSSKKGRRLSIRNPRTGEKLALEELPESVSSAASSGGKKSGRRLSIRDPSSGSKLDLSSAKSPVSKTPTTPSRAVNRRLSIRDPSSGKKLTLETDGQGDAKGQGGLVIMDPNTGERVSLSPFRKANAAVQQEKQEQVLPVDTQRRALDILDPASGQSVMSPKMAARNQERLWQAEQQYQVQCEQQQTWLAQQQQQQWHQPQQQYTQCAQPNASFMYAPAENCENTPQYNNMYAQKSQQPAGGAQIQWSFMQ